MVDEDDSLPDAHAFTAQRLSGKRPRVGTPESISIISRCAYANVGDMEKFHLTYDRAIERKAEWIVKFYGAESFRPVWYDDRVVASRRKLGLPVYTPEHQKQKTI